MAIQFIRPDAKGRITLGKLAHGISSFRLNTDDKYHMILEPMVEVPAKEKWLFDNAIALKKVQQGLQDADLGKLVGLGSFAHHLNDDE